VLLARSTGEDRERRPETVEQLEEVGRAAEAARGDVRGALALAATHASAFPLPGAGSTLRLWESLATLGSVDLTVARAVEPHVDALAILAQASAADAGSPVTALADGARTWGVFAAEGPGARLEARTRPSGIRLSGRKPWCSLASTLSHALVTAWCSEDERALYAVELGAVGVVASEGGWVARGLRDVPSGPVDFDEVPAIPVGGPGWYLARPGFAWGGIGVAAVWYGGAVGIARRLLAQADTRRLDQIGEAHLGAVDTALWAARSTLLAAAEAVDGGAATGSAGSILAQRARQVVARAAEMVLLHADHAMGPAPLALEEEHAARVADLRLYLRQEHAERDQAALGAALVRERADTGASPW
jgi:hypothetical protein